MKRVVLVMLLAIATLLSSNVCAAEESVEEELTQNVEETLDDLDLSELERWFDSLDEDARAALGGDLKSAVETLLDGSYDGGADKLLGLAADYALGSVTDMLAVCVTVFAIALLYSVLAGMSSSFLKKQTCDLIAFVCFAAAATVVLVRVSAVAKRAFDCANTLNALMQGAFPIVLTLLTATGGTATASAMAPLMSLLSGAVSSAVTAIVLPLFVAATAIGVVGNISPSVKLDKFRSFLSSAAKTVLAAAFGLFVTLMTVGGISGSIADSVSIKAAKFAVQSYLPLLGGYLSDGFDLVLASVVLVKNSLGAVVALSAIAAIAVPVVELAVTSLGLKLVAGLVEPFSGGRFSSMLSATAKNISIAAESVIALGVAFVIAMMCAVASCNAGVI